MSCPGWKNSVRLSVTLEIGEDFERSIISSLLKGLLNSHGRQTNNIFVSRSEEPEDSEDYENSEGNNVMDGIKKESEQRMEDALKGIFGGKDMNTETPEAPKDMGKFVGDLLGSIMGSMKPPQNVPEETKNEPEEDPIDTGVLEQSENPDLNTTN